MQPRPFPLDRNKADAAGSNLVPGGLGRRRALVSAAPPTTVSQQPYLNSLVSFRVLTPGSLSSCRTEFKPSRTRPSQARTGSLTTACARGRTEHASLPRYRATAWSRTMRTEDTRYGEPCTVGTCK
ncbi:uncharacterized protein B0H18DRAFT_36648 [Fomitopsis serialis]|uniref:uncharacterized protein n=1 Tax=Fomitopsis serialis TaxID=139415 RepID=UPI002008BF44|nr:uncharacterized protein B0H18DRAFT_36648 [Neoantrodia serialis]KAH9917432.1 hypothetical protein B0H18DRAFT_36648 [Neoantrodia serialis]